MDTLAGILAIGTVAVVLAMKAGGRIADAGWRTRTRFHRTIHPWETWKRDRARARRRYLRETSGQFEGPR